MSNKEFVNRHVGVNRKEIETMLSKIGVANMEQLIAETIPDNIRLKQELELPEAMTEREYAEHIAEIASKNEIFTSYIGMGWYDTCAPAVIFRNVFENPCWYTSYTPYQAEISQGRLEALLNFQTMISDLTALPLANCSLLDEATAAAEAANMLFQTRSREQIKNDAHILFVDEKVFESTLAVLNTRTQPQGIVLKKGNYQTFEFSGNEFGAIIQYPNADGSIEEYKTFVKKATASGARVAVAADLMSLALLTPPGEWGADVVFGSSQRFGIPMYYGGPSAGYFATKDEYKRNIPGRIIGISKDVYGKRALRLALQTREQHIKREKATSNICTAQALLATMSSFYAVYHGPEGIKTIATRIHSLAGFLSNELTALGYVQENKNYFDTLKIRLAPNASLQLLQETALECKVNLRYFETGEIGISIDETTLPEDLGVLLYIFSSALNQEYTLTKDISAQTYFDAAFQRTSTYLTNEVFRAYHTETELMRYIKKLEVRDMSLTHSMISLGSCTMKLNAASELLPLNDPHFANIHPYAPTDQTEGYTELIENLKSYLGVITGLPGVSFQPNSGAAGEYSGLMTIREYLKSIQQGHRNIVLIPASAHGTNPASAIQAGFQTVTIRFDENGNTDIEDLRAKAEENKDNLAAFMITYPSTHGIFETNIVEMCQIIHANGGQVYMDGANMNAQVGLTNPGFIGADVCHLNLHKTFAIPHGGGGPGVGPICCAEHLIPFLPSHPEKDGTLNTVAAAPFGSAGILPITYGYLRMMGAAGLALATKTAILNANYLASQLEKAFGIVYKGVQSRVGHELILECRNIKTLSGIDETDIAKRLIDYGFHAPTLSFPVHGTLMIEPTESESLAELNRFVEAMTSIRKEIEAVAQGKADQEDNVLKNAPHPQYEICSNEWTHPYSRTQAAFPAEWIQENKFWVNVARVDNAFGDRNLVTVCLTFNN
ncbi:MAG: Glycine dehydrogenase (decarboxylating) [Candidatus Ordinivivax streblomastigis]|uniref:glycine dehydrogenase (aminomethyl-transferring) n=1 Tax=Candidatus Ordinivivax streblomastigis TaxID=2540710 RepID=A0A5M8P548_9BACT|nr:MAG: Glycine dehydrogenase (decarboxylating) [Candidatus Ordinivivax streblomastigis]